MKTEEVKETTQKKDVFTELFHVDVNEHVEEKNTGKATLKYLSWAWAWAEVRKRYPDAEYVVCRNPETLMPYFYDPQCGILVNTTVTINNETREMWLPVMDGSNAAMKFEPYEVQTKFGTKTINAATMMDINKAIMRCLAKNFAMFGLGLYIYAGEDLPEEPEEAKAERVAKQEETEQKLKEIKNKIAEFLKPVTKTMTQEEKISFVEKKIVPVIGQKNYLICNDLNKLNELFEKLSK